MIDYEFVIECLSSLSTKLNTALKENARLQKELDNPTRTGVCEVCVEKSVCRCDELQIELAATQKELKDKTWQLDALKCSVNTLDKQLELTNRAFKKIDQEKDELRNKLIEVIDRLDVRVVMLNELMGKYDEDHLISDKELLRKVNKFLANKE